MEQSRTERLAQVLMDFVGPRVAGSPGLTHAQDWLLETYEDLGITARREQYGTWLGWEHGTLHVDLVSPRHQTLEARLLAYSLGTDGPLEGDVIALPEVAPLDADSTDWLPLINGKWVLAIPPEASCRGQAQLDPYARPETVERLTAIREQNRRWFLSRAREFNRFGIPFWRGWGFINRLAEAGALGIIESRWGGIWGTFSASPRGRISRPNIGLSCEDYGLVYRLAVNGQQPRLRVDAEASRLGEVPQFNVIAESKGVELPEEYVLLSAHLDSWGAATGATDNGTGTIMILEAMRVLAEAYPTPRRTILAGHWGGEEISGGAGSSSFIEDHSEVVEGLQAMFNQDNGIWRIEHIEGSGFLHAGRHIADWILKVPRDITGHIALEFPGVQKNAGSDHYFFICAGVPAFRLQSNYEEYRNTHHGTRDTYDKIIFDDLRENATLTAMLVYSASEDPKRVPRDRAILSIDSETGEPSEWPKCGPAMRRPTESLWRESRGG